MTVNNNQIILTEEDALVIIMRINKRIREFINDNNPLDGEYHESCDDVLTEDDRVSFTLDFESNQLKEINIYYSYKSMTCCLGGFNKQNQQ